MSAEQMYLLCFLVGFLFSLLSVLAQGLHLHLPGKHLPFHHHHGGGVHHGVPHGPHAHGHHEDSSSALNAGTLMAFLTWFGGTGYLLTHYAGFWMYVVFGLAVAAGFVGALIVFWFTAKFLFRHERELDPADYEMIGVLGRINSGIRAGGTGEIIFSQEGARRTCGARSEDGQAIPRGTDVVVMRYEKGLAYVRPMDHFSVESSRHDQHAH